MTPSVAASGVFFPYTLTPVTLLSGINLAAGSYFVTFLQTNTTSANIVGDLNGNLTVTTAPGAAVNPNATWLNFSADAYPPAGASLNNTGGTLWFSVDGTPAGPAPVPEPASLVLLASGLALVAVRMRRARR